MTAPYQTHSQTSFEAAQAIEPKLKGLQGAVLEFIKQRGPVTDSQIIAALGSPNSIRPRRVELVRMGQVREYGWVRQENGRRAALWVAVYR